MGTVALNGSPDQYAENKEFEREERSSKKSVFFFFYSLIVGGLTLAHAIVAFASDVTSKDSFIMIQMVLYCIVGVIILIVSVFYLLLGFIVRTDMVLNKLRIGRRIAQHICWVNFFPFVISLIFDIYLSIKYAGTNDVLVNYNDYDYFEERYEPVSAAAIFFGFYFSYSFNTVYKFLNYIIFGLISFIVYWFNFFQSGTYRYLSHKQSAKSSYEYVDFIKSQRPIIMLNVSCYHYERRRSGRKGGSRRVRVTTFRDAIEFVYSQCADVSGKFLLNARFKDKTFVKIRMDKQWIPNDQTTSDTFNITCDNFIAANRWRDMYMDFWVQLTIPAFQPRSLCRISDREPFWANFAVYFLISVFYLAMCFRYVFDSICGEQDFLIVKRISVTNQIDTTEFDQTKNIKDAIIPRASRQTLQRGNAAPPPGQIGYIPPQGQMQMMQQQGQIQMMPQQGQMQMMQQGQVMQQSGVAGQQMIPMQMQQPAVQQPPQVKNV